jgi:hypothetical protein
MQQVQRGLGQMHLPHQRSETSGHIEREEGQWITCYYRHMLLTY